MIEKINFMYTDDISVVNKDQFNVHIKLYEGYVDAINRIDLQLNNNPERENANATVSAYRELKRGETYALNGVILHELYFDNIGGSARPDETMRKYIERYFDSMDNWSKDFVATAKASRGWAVLCFDQRSNKLRNISLDSHDLGNIAYSAPIIVLDVYEHAYFLQYANNKNEYIDNFMKNINWEAVKRRMFVNS